VPVKGPDLKFGGICRPSVVWSSLKNMGGSISLVLQLQCQGVVETICVSGHFLPRSIFTNRIHNRDHTICQTVITAVFLAC
jgi:hypothetical protein